MDKPISVRVRDFKDDLVSLVRDSGLPFFIIEPIMRDIYSAVQTGVEQQYQRDKADYEKSLAAKENKEEESHD